MVDRPKAVDVAVVGGGPAGASIAILLARAGVSTAVFNRSDGNDQRIGETLPPVANKLLQDLGVWSSFWNQKHLAAEGVVSAWNDTQLPVNDFFRSPQGTGWSLDRNRFDAMLLEESERVGAIVYRGASIVSCSTCYTQGWQLESCRNGSTFGVLARYLVDASGKTGSGALAFLSRRIVMDRLIGIARFFKCNDRSRYTLVEAAEEGWFYSAGLPNRRFVTVYFTDADIYAHGRKADPHYWKTQVDKAVHTSNRLRQVSASCCERIVSAATSRRARVSGRGWIVGDAALNFDPLSSLGIYKALDSTTQACNSILRTLRGDRRDLSYSNWSDAVFTLYMNERLNSYRAQQRWVGATFWERRRQDSGRQLKLEAGLEPKNYFQEFRSRSDPQSIFRAGGRQWLL